MRKCAWLTIILTIGLTACAHHRSEQVSVLSAPPPPAPPAVITERPAPVPAPTPPTAAATLPPAGQTAPVESQPITPGNPKPPAAAGKHPPATAKPSAPALVAAGVPASVPTPAPVPSTPKPQLDFKAMEQRLRDTSAIGVFTKLSIKNQVDDLLKAFRGYHAGRTPPTLDDLHQRYDGLLLKVVTLVQNDDANLAASISASRSAIWQILSNRESFQAI